MKRVIERLGWTLEDKCARHDEFLKRSFDPKSGRSWYEIITNNLDCNFKKEIEQDE